jgi:predicted PhzF superfamily epimerase YddE/YHI9
MDFPTTPAEPVSSPSDDLLDGVGVRGASIEVGRSKFDYLVQLESEQQVRSVRPDFVRLERLPVRGTIVTARSSDSRFDFVSRFFAPQTGIDEDPVTGSAHCCLAPWWRDRLGKQQMLGHQVSARGGVVRVRVQGERTTLGGQAVTTVRGELVC